MKSRAAPFLIGFLALALEGCYSNEPITAQAPSSDNVWAHGIIAHAKKYCLEERYEPGTAHFDDCVKNKAIADALEEKMLEQVASGQAAAAPPPAQVYMVAPNNAGCIPDVRGMSKGAAFAAGLRGC
jgi:hypothetical protein